MQQSLPKQQLEILSNKELIAEIERLKILINILIIICFLGLFSCNSVSYKKNVNPKQSVMDGFYLYNSYYDYLEDKVLIINSFFFRADTEKKKICLTFDDGVLKNNYSLLVYLSKENIPATFFLVANTINFENIKRYTINNLFEVGIHSFDHSDYSKKNFEEKEKDIKLSIDVFKKYNLGLKYFRPPFGIIDNDLVFLLNKYNLKGVLWSIDSHDWILENHYKKMLDNIIGGSIILFHESHNFDIVRNIIKTLKERGYKFVSLDELLKFKNKTPNLKR